MQITLRKTVAIICFGISSLAEASGFRASVQSAEYSGQGEISVNEGSAASVNYNPAGIAGLKKLELQVGAIFADQEIDGRLAVGDSVETDSNWGKSGNVFYAGKFGDHYFGVGIYSPFGSPGGLSGPEVLAANEAETKISNPTISVAYAQEFFDDRLFLGVALNYGMLDLEYRQGIEEIPGAQLSYEADDTDVSITLGAQLHMGRHHLGLMYRSEAEYEMRGDSQVTTPGLGSQSEASLTLPTPTLVEIGYKFELNSRVNLGIEAEWQDWSQYGDLAVEGTPLGDLSFEFRWDDGYLLQAGANYVVNENRTMRVGYAFNKGVQNPMFYRPSFTDMDKDWFSVGVSQKIGSFLMHASLLYGTGEESIDSGTTGDGKYKFTGKIAQFSLSRQF